MKDMFTFVVIGVVGHHFISLFFHSFFLHRYGTHKQVLMNKSWERFFFLLTYVAQGTSFLDPRAYAETHLKHHKHSDTKDDPHSPINFSLWPWGLDFPVAIMKMMLATKEFFSKIHKQLQKDRRELGHLYQDGGFPSFPFIERFAYSWYSKAAWFLVYVGVYYLFVPFGWLWLFIILNILTGPIQGAMVNWCGHMWGLVNFKTGDNSKNTPLLDIPMLGETNQNNHHGDADNPNFAVKWYEFDFIYPFILLFDVLGIARIAKEKYRPRWLRAIRS